MNTRKKRFVVTTAIAVITILVLLFGGAGATALAAQSALPGDALYPLKTGLEQTRVVLARDAYDQAQLHLAFAQRRLDEMAELVRQGRYNDVELASSQFEGYIQQAIAALETVMAGDPERGLLLSNQITNTLLSYALVLKEVMAGVPDAIRPAVERAIHASQSSAGEEIEFIGVVESISDDSWVVSGQTISIISATEIKGAISVGDQVKVHAILGSDGSLTAREIELSGGDDDGNSNANDNDDNGNANDNDDNSNANDNDDNGNDNDNDDNGNANDNGNDNDDNANDNDDNGNDNDDNSNDNDDNGNDNDDNGNANDNDDNGNANDNGNDNDDNGNDNDDNGNANDNGNDNNDNGNGNNNDDDDDDNGNDNDDDDD